MAPFASVAELVDALDSKSSSGNRVWVRFPPEVQFYTMISSVRLSMFICLLCFISKSFSQLEAKVNSISTLALIPNVGIEVQVGDKQSLQLDVLGSFWNKLNKTKTPLHINQTFLEYRFYSKNDIQGFFIAPHVGYGMFTLKKPSFAIIYDFWKGGSYENNTYQSGRVAFYGFSLGYKKKVSKRISLEGFFGLGYTMANYKGYTEDVRSDVVSDWRTFNRSGEFTAYRGGVMVNYTFRPFKTKN